MNAPHAFNTSCTHELRNRTSILLLFNFRLPCRLSREPRRIWKKIVLRAPFVRTAPDFTERERGCATRQDKGHSKIWPERRSESAASRHDRVKQLFFYSIYIHIMVPFVRTAWIQHLLNFSSATDAFRENRVWFTIIIRILRMPFARTASVLEQGEGGAARLDEPAQAVCSETRVRIPGLPQIKVKT